LFHSGCFVFVCLLIVGNGLEAGRTEGMSWTQHKKTVVGLLYCFDWLVDCLFVDLFAC
jgi:hypothetical protein